MIGQTAKKTPLMANFVIDYREEVCNLITELYEPADEISKEFKFTTVQLTERLKQILPYKAIDSHLVYECLKDLNFKPSEVPGKPLKFRWYFKRKNNF